jgi:lipopolysaccharide export system permease protein
MTLLDRYILRRIAMQFATYLAIALGILLVERMLRVLDIVLNANGALATVLEMLAFLVPHYLGLALPAAFFLAVHVVFDRLSKDGEIDAAQAAGIGLARLARPVVAASVLVAVLVVAVFGYFQPMGRYAYRAAVHAVTTNPQLSVVRAGSFQTFKGMTVFVDRLSPDRQSFGPVLVFSDRPGKGTSTITARKGWLATTEDGRRLVVRLRDGLQLSDDGTPARGPAAAMKGGSYRFDSAERILPVETGLNFRPRGEDARELTLLELWRARFSPPPGLARAAVNAALHDRIARSAALLILPFLAIPLAVGRRRVRHGWGLVIGLVILIIDNELMQYGLVQATAARLSPWLGLWGPLLPLAAIALVLFHRAAFRVGRDMGGALANIGAALIPAAARRQPESEVVP